jgi:hypothetical protein
MSDFFDRLAGSARGDGAGAIQPRVQSWYTPSAGTRDLAGLDVRYARDAESPTDAADAALPARARRRRRDRWERDERDGADGADGDARGRLRAAGDARASAADRERGRDGGAHDRGARDGDRDGGARDSSGNLRVAAARGRDEHAPASDAPSAGDAAARTGDAGRGDGARSGDPSHVIDARLRDRSQDFASSNALDGDDAGGDAGNAADAAAERAARERAAAASAARERAQRERAERDARAHEPRTIRVHIGRVDVRAVFPAQPAPAPRADVRASAAMPLDRFLSRGRR